MNTRLTSFLLLAAILPLPGCIGMAPPTEIPIPGIASASARPPAKSLVIMLPGGGDRAGTFVSEGFPDAGRRLGFDTIAVDAHFGYYRKRSLLPRLHEDIVLPARDAGYENVWLLGISMGGFGSLLYAAEHPEQVDGVILLAPFLGDRSSIDEITAAGGLGKWTGTGSGLEEYEIAIWSWIRDATLGTAKTPLILGYGLSDSMADSYALLTAVLEPSRVYTREGGHKWTTWGPLWEQIAAELGL